MRLLMGDRDRSVVVRKWLGEDKDTSLLSVRRIPGRMRRVSRAVSCRHHLSPTGTFASR